MCIASKYLVDIKKEGRYHMQIQWTQCMKYIPSTYHIWYPVAAVLWISSKIVKESWHFAFLNSQFSSSKPSKLNSLIGSGSELHLNTVFILFKQRLWDSGEFMFSWFSIPLHVSCCPKPSHGSCNTQLWFCFWGNGSGVCSCCTESVVTDRCSADQQNCSRLCKKELSAVEAPACIFASWQLVSRF